jgi:hypothetical protein
VYHQWFGVQFEDGRNSILRGCNTPRKRREAGANLQGVSLKRVSLKRVSLKRNQAGYAGWEKRETRR